MEPIDLDAAPTELATPKKGVLVVTDDGDDATMAAARSLAAKMAAPTGATVTLYDRSGETWGDTPHPEGPFPPGSEELRERPHLRIQMEEIRELGAEVQAWLATLPTISSVEVTLSEIGADVIVVAETMPPHLLERVLEGRSIAEIVATQLSRQPHLDAVVVEVLEDRTARTVEPV